MGNCLLLANSFELDLEVSEENLCDVRLTWNRSRLLDDRTWERRIVRKILKVLSFDCSRYF